MLSVTHSAAIGLVVRSHLRDVLVRRRNRVRNGELPTVRFDFLVSNLAMGFHAFSGGVQFGVLDSVQVLGFWVKETLGCDLFSRVGACGRRPSESADPGASVSWVLLKKRYRVK